LVFAGTQGPQVVGGTCREKKRELTKEREKEKIGKVGTHMTRNSERERKKEERIKRDSERDTHRKGERERKRELSYLSFLSLNLSSFSLFFLSAVQSSLSTR